MAKKYQRIDGGKNNEVIKSKKKTKTNKQWGTEIKRIENNEQKIIKNTEKKIKTNLKKTFKNEESPPRSSYVEVDIRIVSFRRC